MINKLSPIYSDLADVLDKVNELIEISNQQEEDLKELENFVDKKVQENG